MKKKGFTIVELALILVVIGILGAILIPAMSKMIRESTVTSDMRVCQNLNMKNNIAYAYESGNSAPDTVNDVITNVMDNGAEPQQFATKTKNTALYWLRSINTIVYVDKSAAENVESNVYTPEWKVLYPEAVAELEQNEVDALFTMSPASQDSSTNYYEMQEAVALNFGGTVTDGKQD